MKQLLVLTDAITAPLYAPRMRYLVSNLAKTGWQCTVASEQADTDFVFPDCKHLRFVFYAGKHPWWDKCVWLLDKFVAIKERAFLRFVRKQTADKQFDYILCSAFHTFPLPTAAHLAKERHIPFIVDLRDIAEQWGETPYMQHPIRTPFKKLNHWLTKQYTAKTIRQRNKALAVADAITTVSPWHITCLQNLQIKGKALSNISLIYNGFDTQTFSPKDQKTSYFDITYTGKIYDFTLRNPQLLFHALGELRKENVLPADIRLRFYCENTIHPSLHHLAESYHIDDLLQTAAYVSKEQIPELLHQSSIILILTNKSTANGPHGIMTTKFFEALGVEKPVLCVRSDEECLAQVIHDTNAGLAATNTEDIKSFILNKHREWQANGYTRQPIRNKQLFTRQHQARQFETLFSTLRHD